MGRLLQGLIDVKPYVGCPSCQCWWSKPQASLLLCPIGPTYRHLTKAGFPGQTCAYCYMPVMWWSVINPDSTARSFINTRIWPRRPNG